LLTYDILGGRWIESGHASLDRPPPPPVHGMAAVPNLGSLHMMAGLFSKKKKNGFVFPL
jgi:hypothetical protein